MAIATSVAAAASPGRANAAHDVLIVLLVWFLCQSAIGLATGVLGAFALAPVASVELVLFGLGCLLCARHPSRVTRMLRSWRDEAHATPGALAGFLCIAFGVLVSLTRHAIVDFDSLAYHLPPVASWIQGRSILPLEQVYYHYPFTWEAVAGLFILPFGEDFAIGIPQWFGWIMFALAMFLVARDLGASKLGALTGTLLVVSMPSVRSHLSSLHVDLALAAFFMAGLHCALILACTGPGDLVRMALVIVAAALTASVKTSGVGYAVLILGVAIAARWRRSPAQGQSAQDRGTAVALAVTAAAVGSFWYVAWAVTGHSPIGDVELRVAGMTLVPGGFTADDVARTTLLGRFEPTDSLHLGLLLTALWHAFGTQLLVLLALVLAFIWRLPESSRPARADLIVLGTLTVATVTMHAATPYSGTNPGHGFALETRFMTQAMRYAFPAVALLGVWGALAAGAATRHGRTLFAASITPALAGIWDRTDLAIVALGLAVWAGWQLAGFVPATLRGRHASHGIVLGCSLFLVILVSWTGRRARATDRSRQYGGVQEFISRTLRADEAVGYVLSCRPYVLYGSRLQQAVVALPRASAGPAEWFDELRRRGVRLIAVGPLSRKNRRAPEPTWLLSAESPFERVYGNRPNQEIVLFQLRQR